MKKILIGIGLSIAFLYGAVDINSANVKELTTIKGIGEKKAKAIIEYRQKECFKKPEDLMKIKGISEKTFKKIKKDIKVGKCSSHKSKKLNKVSKSSSI